MISPEFDVAEFVNAMQDRDLHDILRLSESEATEAQKVAELKGYGQEYADAVKAFVYLVRYGQKPVGIDQKQFQAFRPVCEKLAAKRQLLPDILRLFDSDE